MEVRKLIKFDVPRGPSYFYIEVNKRKYFTSRGQTGNEILDSIEKEAFERGKLEAKEEISSAYRTFLASFGGFELIKAEVRDE